MRLSREHPVQIADLTHGARRVRSRNKVWRINIITNIFDAMFNFSIITPILFCAMMAADVCGQINVVSYFKLWIAIYHFADGNGPPFRGPPFLSLTLQQAQLSPRDRATRRVSWTVRNVAQMFVELHLISHATGQWPSRSPKVIEDGTNR